MDDEHHDNRYEDGEPVSPRVAALAYPEWRDTSMSWDDADFNSPDPFTRYNAHQAAKGRTTRTYTETSVSCEVCNAKLNEREVARLDADTDFVEHGSPPHLIRVIRATPAL
jgi:hypothetical protein